jgi:raffinose/stachyose/melibiose transport system substrate-binding protein
MKKKILALLLAAMVMVSLLAACAGSDTGDDGSKETAKPTDAATTTDDSAGGTDLSGVTLEVAVTYTGDQATVFQGVIADFEAATGCTVNISEYGADYENTMKSRMASNELPDVFQTHGWSILRYKEYLMDLSDQAWVSDLDESALGVIQDTDGAIYVLMVSELINGTLVNLDVCEAAGVDPYSIHTWDDLGAACAQIKEAGYTPIGSVSNPGLLANIAGTWVSYEGEQAEDSAAMLDGTWDWQSYKPLLDTYASWIGSGYFYEDILTMNDTDFMERYASGEAAFCIGNDPSVFINALTLNPNAKFAFLPTFASTADGKEFVGIGEGDTFGIWKDTKNADASKALLDYLATPEVALAINASTGKISCLKSTMDIDDSYGLSVFTEMKEKCATSNILYENLCDRKYMPSGMWPIFGNASAMLFDDYSEAGIAAVMEYLNTNYLDLYEAAQAG